MFQALITKSSRLTGTEVKFVRTFWELTQSEFAKRLNQSNHSVVSQWEKRSDRPAGMDYNTELLLRLHMAAHSRKALVVLLPAPPFSSHGEVAPVEVDLGHVVARSCTSLGL